MVSQVHAKHILVEKHSHALQVLDELNAGKSFEEVAKQRSICPSRKKGGDLGWFRKGQMVKAFEKAAFELEVGKVSEPVKTQFGYHIILVVEKK